jgi:putative Holliday junction resolvase
MRSLGLDLGDRRTGVAISDPQGLLAIPLTVLSNKGEDATIANILKLAEQYQVERIVIGLPYSLDGNLGRQANKVTAFAEKLQNVIANGAKQSSLVGLDIQLWDERLSTKAAEKLMVEAGIERNKRKHRRDAVAAAFILQGFLDSRRPEQ